MPSKRCTTMLAIAVAVLAGLMALAPATMQAEPAQAQPFRLPTARRNHSLVHDSDNGRLLLFGGWSGRRFLNDVWALDLQTNTWYQIRPSGTPPPPRAWHAAGEDLLYGRMVIIGGRGYGGDLDDVWAMSLTPGAEAWAELDPRADPFAPRHSMAFDEAGGRIFMYGGMAEGEALDEAISFTWGGTGAEQGAFNWLLDTGTTRAGATAAYDYDGDRLFVFGGADENGNSDDLYVLGDLLAYPRTWNPFPLAGPPPARRYHTAIHYDLVESAPISNTMLVFGGLGDSGFLNDLWTLTTDEGTEAWSQITPNGGPPPARAGHAAVHNPDDDRMYVVGGFGPYNWLEDQGWTLDLATYTWAPLQASYNLPGDVSVSLQIEDAREGVVVHKLPNSKLQVVVKLATYYPELAEDLQVTLTVHGGVLDFSQARLRDSDQGLGLLTFPTEPSPGQYRISGFDLRPRGQRYERQAVFAFDLVYDVFLGDVPLTVQVEQAGNTDLWQSTGAVHICDSAEALVITNRTLLYEGYDEEEVSELLAGAFEAAQGDDRNDNPLGVVVYVDRYTAAENWDNTDVSYASEQTANLTAADIRGAIRDFYGEADEPEYLLIVGDDDVVPFYRNYDPTGDEGFTASDCDGDNVADHEGWCRDSNTNPAIQATDYNYYFTDDYYGDMGGDDWTTGDIELAVGRLVGERAADMLNLLRSGTSLDKQDTGRAWLSSLDGWQLGFIPAGNVPDAVPNVLDVPARIVSRGFDVRNDTEVPRTVDVVEPDWDPEDLDPALEEGFDLFFHGGVSGDYRGILGTGIAIYAAQSDQLGIPANKPVFFLPSSYQGLSVPPPEGGNCCDMPMALAEGGASGLVGSTAAAYGSVGSLDQCVQAELFAQVFFDQLLSSGSESLPLGMALRQAKQDYPFDVGNLCGYETGQDEKTVTEQVLYGVPWQTLFYPSETTTGEQILSLSPPALEAAHHVVGCTDSGDYSQTFTAEFTYTATISDGWDILTVPDARLDATDGYPLLPTQEVLSLCLPVSATVTGLELLQDDAAPIGAYNIPNVQFLPWDQGGMTYTSTAAVNDLYPTPIITGEHRGQLFVVHAIPIQHNPTSDETVFHEQIEVRLTYTSPTPVALCGFRTDAHSYLPGQTVNTLALVRNVGGAGVVLTPTLALLDPLTRTWAVQVGTSSTLEAGGSALVPMALDAPLEEGAYRVLFSVWSQGERQAATLRGMAVLGGRITALRPTGPLFGEQAGEYEVTFSNPWPGATIAFVHLVVLDALGQVADDLSPQVMVVPGGGSATVSFAWTPAGLPAGDYTVAAWVTARGQVYGPLSRSFHLARLYLPIIRR
jgi:hypothetical protein